MRNSELKQVLMVSRHSVRAPLDAEIDYMEQFITQPWPKWEVPNGQPARTG